MPIRRSTEIESLVRRWMQAQEDGNIAVMRNMFSESEHLRYLGSGFGENWSGDLFRQGYAEHRAEVPKITVEAAEVEAFESGETGWAMWAGTVGFPDRAVSFEYRFTFVFALEDGFWRMIQVHVSTPRANKEVIGRDHEAFDALIAAARDDAPGLGTEGTLTIMFTDIANSTELAAAMGDRAWAQTIGAHFDMQAREIAAAGGTLIKTLGDGTMASFPSAGAALRAAAAIAWQDDASSGLAVRIGLHTGDVVAARGDFFGTVVNKAARIAALAEPREVLVSETTRAMLASAAGLRFSEPVSVALRGIEGTHAISSLAGG